MLKTTQNKRKHHKRYFTLNLIELVFSYRKSQCASQDILGIHLSTIHMVEGTNANFPIKEFTKAIYIHTDKKQLTLLCTQPNHVKWLNGFAAVTFIKIRPKLIVEGNIDKVVLLSRQNKYQTEKQK